jgi:hypothetical protein
MSGFDYLVRMQEANILNRILGGSLTYRITRIALMERKPFIM